VNEWMEQFLDYVRGLGPWGPVVLAVVYVIATVFFVPGTILTLGAGFLFGVVAGAITVSIGSTIGATAAFFVGRYIARDWVAAKVANSPKFEAIDEAVAREGWKIVGLTRLSPVFPFNLLNYAYGLTKVKAWHYILASWIGMMPGTVMYVYFGSIAGNLATLGADPGEGNAAKQVLTWVGLAATVAVTILITRVARRALTTTLEEEKPEVAEEI